MKHRTNIVAAAAIGVLSGLMGLGGCARDKMDPGPQYPAAMPQYGTLDIQVFRRTTTMEFTNSTPRAFGKSRIWLNRRFSREIEKIAVGETVELELSEFIDHHGDVFKAGGFFSAEVPDIIALAQLETTTLDGTPILLGFVTVKAGDQ